MAVNENRHYLGVSLSKSLYDRLVKHITRIKQKDDPYLTRSRFVADVLEKELNTKEGQ